VAIGVIMTTKANPLSIAILSLLTWVAGCGLLPKAPSVADPKSVYAWPIAACPSAPPAVQPAFFAPALVAGLAGTLLSDLVSGVVGVPVAAIQAAADADKNGFKASGQNARLYFPIVTVDQSTSPPTSAFSPPKCYIVAYTKFEKLSGSATAQRWCDDPGFSAGVPSACTASGKSRLDGFGTPTGFSNIAPAVPDFYAEIELDASDYALTGQEVVRPRVIAVYYPHSLIEPASSKPRTVTVGLNLTSPGAPSSDPIKGASVSVVLQGITPGAAVSTEALASQQSAWIVMPTTNDTLGTHALPTQSGPFYPVNISTSLTEIGDPSLFLAAFAKAVGSSATDLSKDIVSAIPTIPTAATQQQAQTSLATLNKAIATAEGDRGKYLAACIPPPTTEAAKSNARSAYYTVIADRQSANSAAFAIAAVPGAGGSSLPFPDVRQNLTECF
jgi:hypothetical protein